MALDTSPTTQDALSLIVMNYNAGLDPALHLNDEDFAFDPPILNPDSAVAKNTRLFARALATSGKYGRATIYYDRIDLTEIVDAPTITRLSDTTWSQVVPLINDYFGINIVAADYTDAPLPAQSGALMDATLSVVSGSLMFLGGLPLKLKSGAALAIEPTA